MDFESMSRQELIRHLEELNKYMDNVVVFWGGKREFRETFGQVAENRNNEYTEQEAANARTILQSEGAFEDFIEMVRDSFERGGIEFFLSEKITALMEEVAGRCGKNN